MSNYYFDNLTLSELSENYEIDYNDIRLYINYLYSLKYSNKTISRHISSIRSFFKYLKGNNYITDNPCILISNPKIDKKLPKYLNYEETEKLLNSFDKNKWNIFYKSLEKHQIVSYFEAIENNSFYFDEEDTLYVPKEDRSQCGTLSEINDYIRDKTRRDLGLYINQLKINDGLYCLDDTEIKKIVFVFDTLQSGTSTKDYLNLFFYPDENSKKKNPKYYCEEKEISLKKRKTCMLSYGKQHGFLGRNDCLSYFCV